MSASVTPINQRSSMLAYAQNYAKLGWHVLPLVPGAKQPLARLVPNGFHNATRDPATIEKWWAAEPAAGIGIALKASGLVAVDIDVRNDGFQTLDDLQARHGKLESDAHQITGDGGWHLVYAAQLVESLPGKLGRGIDLKADGYICVEPSVHPNGKTYVWEAESSPLDGCIPSTLPGWIRDMARTPLPVPEIVNPTTAPTPRWLDCLAALPSINADDRETWLQVGMAIHNERPDAEGYRAWAEWSATSAKFDARDQSRVWASFTRRGISGTTLNTVFAFAQRSGWKNVAHAPSAPASEARPIDPQTLILDIKGLRARASAARWAVKHVIPENSLGMFFGASGAFKSFVVLDYALHRCYGMKWLGQKTKQGIPVYIAAEGGAGLIRRIDAWHAKHKLDPDSCPLRVVIEPLTLTTEAATLRQAIETLSIQPADVIVDTMSQTFDGEENSAKEVSAFFRQLGAELRAIFECTVIVVHHTGLSADDRARGSSAIGSNLDFQFSVAKDGPKSLITTLTCVKQKDGERIDPVNFVLEEQILGRDEDGDKISSLSASWIDQVGSLLHHMEKAQAGDQFTMLQAIRECPDTKSARRAFYEKLGGINQDTKKKKWQRTKELLLLEGLIEELNNGDLKAKEVSQ